MNIQYELDLKEAKTRFAIQRKFCWNGVQMKLGSVLDKLSHDERMKLQMAITNAPCVSECQNFELYYSNQNNGKEEQASTSINAAIDNH